jgi:transposase InsO family protein
MEGGEYFSNEFSEYLKEHGIQKKYSCSYCPQQNGIVERKNKHIAEITCAMLDEKNLPNYFWAEVVATIVYIMNRTPIAIVHGMTPKENSHVKNQMFHTLECFVALHTCMFLKRRYQTRPKS